MAKKEPKNINEIGKIQPHAVDIEKAILGACLLMEEAFFVVSSILKPHHFYSEQNSLVYQAMINLSSQSKSIDIYTVSIELRTMKQFEVVGGGYYISSLTENTSTLANIEVHSRIVIQKALLREMILIGTQIVQKAYDDSTDCFDLIDWSGNSISGILNGIENKQAERIDKIKDTVIQNNKDALIKGINEGVPISVEAMQKHLNGWRPGHLIILAARPGMGKTAVALDFSYYPAISFKTPTAYFSMEVPKEELASRLMAKHSHISSQKITNNMADSNELTAIIRDTEIMKDVPLYIDDTPSLSLTRLRSKAFRLVQLYGIKQIVIDYLQLMEGAGDDNGNREQEISKISRGLKKLARELNIPIIALAQLSRNVENRPGGSKRPQLSDLRDSGSIEQDADMVVFIYRPEYYGINVHTHGNEEMNNTKGLMILNIAKYRQGAVADIRVKWHGSTNSISDWDKKTLPPITSEPPINYSEPNKQDDLPF